MTGRYDYAFMAIPDDLYREDAAFALANLFDLCVNVYGFSGQDVADAFTTSNMARQFELQNPVFVTGKSACELAELLMPQLGGHPSAPGPHRYDRTPDYWLGWVLALYQMETGRPYSRIFNVVSYNELVSMYHPLHEAPEQKFFEALEALLHKAHQPTRLRIQRDAASLSQAELASQSGVGLRSIQMYEQRNKDINKAQVATVVRLARALHCSIEDLLEAG